MQTTSQGLLHCEQNANKVKGFADVHLRPAIHTMSHAHDTVAILYFKTEPHGWLIPWNRGMIVASKCNVFYRY